MANGLTPHNEAAKKEIAKTVLMPGDPLRAQWIAKEFLEGARLVNNIRGVQGYTGRYLGHDITVMASGMGMPSMGIYSYELFHFYDVDRILRIGSAGAIRPELKLLDLVFGMGASTDSSYPAQYHLPGTIAPIADFELLRVAVEAAKAKGASYRVGNLLSSDRFYNFDPSDNFKWSALGVLAVEMEAAALYLNAAHCGKSALAICTVSDQLVTGEALGADERRTAFSQMVEVALAGAVAAEKERA